MDCFWIYSTNWMIIHKITNQQYELLRFLAHSANIFKDIPEFHDPYDFTIFVGYRLPDKRILFQSGPAAVDKLVMYEEVINALNEIISKRILHDTILLDNR